MFLKRFFFLLGSAVLIASCGEGGTITESIPVCDTPTGGNIVLSGTIRFERVLHDTFTSGLDYSQVRSDPARGITVQAINSRTNNVIAAATTNGSGIYSLVVPDNTAMFIRVRAEMISSGGANYTFRVIDNTNANALYVMDGSHACTTTANETRSMLATHGWTGSGYDNRIRLAGPFAILDTVYKGVQFILAVQPSITFPLLNLNWSVNNSANTIGSSFFRPSSNEIFILGAADDDTDEYDEHVIAHEWGHYLEANFSRSDSIGGFHTSGDRLDMRVAFGEGFGNAFSAMVLGDPVYRDSLFTGQAFGFSFNMETETLMNPGWYSEQSVEQIVYDLYDNTSGEDPVNLGFGPIWTVLTNTQKTGVPLTSIFSFIDTLKNNNAGVAAAIDTLVSGFSINTIVDPYGAGETHASTASNPNTTVLPIYTAITVDGPSQNICVMDEFERIADAGAGNTLGMRRFLRFTIPTSTTYTFTATGAAGDPDMILHQAGAFYYSGGLGTSETFNRFMAAGDYVLEFLDYDLFDPNNTPKITQRCFTITISTT